MEDTSIKPSKGKRSIPIIIAIVIIALWQILVGLNCLPAYIQRGIPGIHYIPTQGPLSWIDAPFTSLQSDIIGFITTVLAIMSGVSLLTLKPWARKLFIHFMIFKSILSVTYFGAIYIQRLNDYCRNSYLVLSLMLISHIITIWLFTLSKVKEQFK